MTNLREQVYNSLPCGGYFFREIYRNLGEPTVDLSPEDTGASVRILTYQPAAGFQLQHRSWRYDEDDNVSLIYPQAMLKAVDEDNVMNLSAYYDINVLDMSLINFEDNGS